MVKVLAQESLSQELDSATTVDAAPSSDTNLELPAPRLWPLSMDLGPSGNRALPRLNSDLVAAPRVWSAPRRPSPITPEAEQVTRRLRTDLPIDAAALAQGQVASGLGMLRFVFATRCKVVLPPCLLGICYPSV